MKRFPAMFGLLALLCLVPTRLIFSEDNTLRCPDNLKPNFTGHPFHPYVCGDYQTLADGDVPVKELPDQNGSVSLKRFVGTWEALGYYGARRVALLAKFERSGSRYRIIWETMDYHLHTKNKISATLNSLSFWNSKNYKVDASLDNLPHSNLPARLWIGKPPKSRAMQTDAVEFLWKYEGHGDLHRTTCAKIGAVLSCTYVNLRDGSESQPVSAQFSISNKNNL